MAGIERKKCPKCGQPMQWRGGVWVCMNPDCERFGEREKQDPKYKDKNLKGTLSDQLKNMFGME